MSEEHIQAGVQKLTGIVNANLDMPGMFVQHNPTLRCPADDGTGE